MPFLERKNLLYLGKRNNGIIKANVTLSVDIPILSSASSFVLDIIAFGIAHPPIFVSPLFKRVCACINAVASYNAPLKSNLVSQMPPAQRSRHCSLFQMTLKNFAHVPYRKIFSDIIM